MITLYTEKRGNRNVYVRVDTNAKNKVILRREASRELIRVRQDDGTVGFVLVDADGNSNPYFHRFINSWMVEKGCSENTRSQAAGVIKRLYAFLDLMGYSLYTMGQSETIRLRTFLAGTGRMGCSNLTVNAYLSCIRQFLKANSIPNDALFEQREVYGRSGADNEFRVSNVYYTYTINLPVNPHRGDHVPKYVSMDDYERLIREARREGDWTAIMLMHLMFRYGMRLGECLGLTEEDFRYSTIKGQLLPVLYIRNRCSDAPYQRAKRRLTPTSPAFYRTGDYTKQWRDDEFSHIWLSESTDFAKIFEAFIRETRERNLREHPDNYRSCEADIVAPDEFRDTGLERNHYIFTNRLGCRLSAQVWGMRLKAYFVKVGLSVDVDRKDKNLSHRFRHGFAMMHAHFMDPPVPVHELKLMMRHVCITSTLIYYNPTVEDEYEMKTRFQNRFYDTNPELNAIIGEFLTKEVTYGE